MQTTQLHDVTSIKLTQIRHVASSSKPFYTRELVVTMADGLLHIPLYGTSREALEIVEEQK